LTTGTTQKKFFSLVLFSQASKRGKQQLYKATTRKKREKASSSFFSLSFTLLAVLATSHALASCCAHATLTTVPEVDMAIRLVLPRRKKKSQLLLSPNDRCSTI
jgi:hypothetical protein